MKKGVRFKYLRRGKEKFQECNFEEDDDL